MWTKFVSICTYKNEKQGVIDAEPCFILPPGKYVKEH